MTSWALAAVSAVRTELYRQLDIRPGVTAIIGSGGKTSLMLRLCRELPGSVIVCTSTRIFPPEELPLHLHAEKLRPGEKCCVGTPAELGKLAAPQQSFAELAELADYVLVEADGSKGLPLKAHLAHEPVIPPCSNQTILVLGLSGLGKPICRAAHRPERYAELCGAAVTEPVTSELAALVLQKEALHTRVVLNQSDTADGTVLAALLNCPVICTALHPGEK